MYLMGLESHKILLAISQSYSIYESNLKHLDNSADPNPSQIYIVNCQFICTYIIQ